MPQTLNQRLKLMTLCAGVEFGAILAGLVCLGCFLTALFGNGPWLPCLLLVLACAGIIAFCTLYPKHLGRKADLSPYAIPIPCSDFEGVCAALSAQRFEEDAALAFRKYSGCSLRLLIQHCTEFDQKAISARRKALNKAINRRRSISQWGPSSEVLKGLRINLVVCRKPSDAAVSWLRRDPEGLLERNEAIVNAIVCLEEQHLLLPAVLAPLGWGTLRKYRTAMELLAKSLSAGVEK